MGWLASIGGAVMGFFGASAATIAASGLATMVIGGTIVGACVGALYSAVTGGNILEGALYGAIGGAVVGAGGFALGYGGATPTLGAEGVVAGKVAPGGIAPNVGGGIGGEAVKDVAAGSLFTSESLQAAGTIASMGSAFLKGGAEIDADAQIAEAEKDRQLKRDLADKQLAASSGSSSTALQQTREQIASNEKLSEADRELKATQFTENIDFQKKQYEEEKELTETGRQRFETGVGEASKYVRGETKSVTLVESKQQRQSLPNPIWQDQQTQTASASQGNGILNQGAVA